MAAYEPSDWSERFVASAGASAALAGLVFVAVSSITLDDALVSELDGRVGPRRRSSYVAGAVRQALDDDRRWELVESSLGSVGAEGGHDWDSDPAAWVRQQRRADAERVG